MVSSNDKKDTAYGNYIPKHLHAGLASSGKKFVEEVLSGPNERCLESFRMDKHVFYKLCEILQDKGLLRHTNRIKIEEQLAIFLFILGHNLRTRAVKELFRYSGETISRHFNKVLEAILSLTLDFFQHEDSNVPTEIREDPRFFPYFKDCIGTVDEMHIPVMVGVDEQGPFRDNNGVISQTALAACSFDLRYLYVLAGWEGSASEVRVLNSALTRQNKLPVPEGKYYILDNKYGNFPGLIAPYPGVPCTNEFPNGYHPQSAKELFNQRHSLLRNTTDRIFAALKARFPIFLSAPPYPLPTQVKLVVVACALHNYIQRENPDDWFCKNSEDSSPPVAEAAEQQAVLDDSSSIELPFNDGELEFASALRDSIAAEMWDDYVSDRSFM